MRVELKLSDEEVRILNHWRTTYLSMDLPNTINGALHDVLRRIADDIKEMGPA